MAAALSSELRSLVAEASGTGHLYLSHMSLAAIPPQVFAIPGLRRLDLSFNELRHLPNRIAELTSLEELWLQGNPLQELPVALGEVRRLQVLDVRDTRIQRIPNEVSRLPRLLVLDLAGTSLRGDLQKALESGGPGALMALLGREDERLELQQNLRAALRERVYTEDADTEAGAAAIDRLAMAVMGEFPDSTELRTVIRNAERLFPPTLASAAAAIVRDGFLAVSEETLRKQLGAEVELRLRAIYFGRTEPEEVERMVHSVLTHQPKLADVKFLLAHAKAVFPESPELVDGAAVYNACVALRRKLAEERAEAFATLVKSVQGKYPEREPSDVKRAAGAVAKLIKDSVKLRSLAADAPSLFPDEFNSINPMRIIKGFRALLREKGVE